MPKKYLYTLLVVAVLLVGGVGFYLYNARNEAKVEESKAEVAALPDRSVAPAPEESAESANEVDSELVEATDSTPADETPASGEDSENSTSSSSPQPTPAPTPEPAPEPTPEPEPQTTTLNTFSFTGVADYTASGSASVTRTGGAATLQFNSDFRFGGGAPDPVVYMCQEANPSGVGNCLTIAALGGNSGPQAWSLTADEAMSYPYPVVWCRAFNVLMARTV